MKSHLRFPTLDERRAEGRGLRDNLAREDHSTWKPSKGRDIFAAIKEGNRGRLAKLIPMKMARMSTSPFAFFRGTAPLMARDLAGIPTTGLMVQLCGDAHVRNLGAYAAPSGYLVFDLNDFDESIRGPWEWDLKRMAASVVLAGRDAGDASKQCAEAVLELACCYRESMHLFSGMKVLDLAKYEIRRQTQNEAVQAVLDKAQRVTPAKTLKKLTERSKEGCPRFHDELPILRHVPDNTRDEVFAALKEYRKTVTAGRQLILDAYHPVDVAFKVVGTGSVGTRDYVVLLFGHGTRDPMFIQIKEELRSCYAAHLAHPERFDNEGRRVAQGQQRMQTVTDPFLGWASIGRHQFLVRQLADHKAAINPADLRGETLLEYAVVCGNVLAKAHARTGNAAALAGYCGLSARLDKAIVKFALAYADQTAADYALFMKAIKSGKIKTEVDGQ